jgi:hypothetical protein
MPDASFQAALDGLRDQLQAALAERVDALTTAHTAALDEARRAAEADAERAAAERIAAARDEAAREGSARVAEVEAEAAARVAKALEQAAAEADRRIDDARRTAAAEARAELEAAVSRERDQRQAGLDAAPLLDTVRAIDQASSLTGILSALTAGTAALGTRVLLCLCEGPALRPWRSEGLPLPDRLAPDGTILDEARRAGVPSSTVTAAAPAFASLAPGGSAIAVPLTVDGTVVAVLYADDGAGERRAFAGWDTAAVVLARHASLGLTHLTMRRTAEAIRFVTRSAPDAGEDEEIEAARRYARIVVSEIKLYHEAGVQSGREQRDLLTRLAPELARARASFDARVPPALAHRDDCFRDAVVEILAGGDAALLGPTP